MYSDILIKRLQKELRSLEREPPPGITCYPKEDDITQLEAYIKGPPDTPYEKGLFKLDIQIPLKYPFEPPQIRFKTLIYHPNIDDSGRICADILKTGGWKPALNLSTTLISLSQLLAHPNPDDPLDADIAKEYYIDYPQFKQKAEEYTLKYATKDSAEDNNNNTNNPLKTEQEEKEENDYELTIPNKASTSLLLLSKKKNKKQGTSKCSSTENDTGSIHTNNTLESMETPSTTESKLSEEVEQTSENASVKDLTKDQIKEHDENPEKHLPMMDISNQKSNNQNNEQKCTKRRPSQHKSKDRKQKLKEKEVAIVIDHIEEKEAENLDTTNYAEAMNSYSRKEELISTKFEDGPDGHPTLFDGNTKATGKNGAKRPYSALELLDVIELSDDDDKSDGNDKDQEAFSEPPLYTLRLSKKLSRATLNLSKKKKTTGN
ncbi:hypothetical protein RMCBS344292_01769 [Rhizopus microsporus]|nr:hypothetical protein RMCBS344292_01769 [Rhizopus microsporus]